MKPHVITPTPFANRQPFAPLVSPKVAPSPVDKPIPKIKVKIVDAFALRNESSDWQEFGNYATHMQYPRKIPYGEIWIANTVPDWERPFLIRAAEAQYQANKDGYNSDDSYEYGLSVDRSERTRKDHKHGGDRPYHKEIPQDIYLEKWKTVQGRKTPVDVWIVDGGKIRGMYKCDFVEGGHAFVYSFIPEEEIWIEDQVIPEERPFVLLHEFTERDLMKHEILNYDDAHEQANKAEFEARQRWKKAHNQKTEGQKDLPGDPITESLIVQTKEPPPSAVEQTATSSGRLADEMIDSLAPAYTHQVLDENAQTPNDNVLTRLGSENRLRFRKKGLGKYGPRMKGMSPSAPISETKSLSEEKKYGCLMLSVTGDLRKEIVDWVLENVPDFHLAKDGRELSPHVTVLFGLTNSDDATISQIQEFLSHQPPIPITLDTSLSVFPGEEYDVLKVGVESDVLRALHAGLSSHFPHHDTHPTYLPHLTLAYLTPAGVSSSYVSQKDIPFLGKKATLDTVLFSGADDRQTIIPLTIVPKLNLPDEKKAMSAYNAGAGGALVPEAEFRGTKPKKRENVVKIISPFYNRKTLDIPRIKSGFTGQMQFRDGSTHCYVDGQQTSCNNPQGGGQQAGQGGEIPTQQAPGMEAGQEPNAPSIEGQETTLPQQAPAEQQGEEKGEKAQTIKHPSTEEDKQIIRAVREGERDAFTQLVKKYGPQLTAIFKGKLRNRGDVDSAVMEAFGDFWVKILDGSYDEERAPMGLLSIIAFRRIADEQREEGRRREVSGSYGAEEDVMQSVASQEESPEESLEASEESLEMQERGNKLKDFLEIYSQELKEVVGGTRKSKLDANRARIRRFVIQNFFTEERDVVIVDTIVSKMYPDLDRKKQFNVVSNARNEIWREVFKRIGIKRPVKPQKNPNKNPRKKKTQEAANEPQPAVTQ